MKRPISRWASAIFALAFVPFCASSQAVLTPDWVDATNQNTRQTIDALSAEEQQALLLEESSFLRDYQRWSRHYLPRFQHGGDVVSYSNNLKALFADPLPMFPNSGNWYELGPNEPIDETVMTQNASSELGTGPVDFIELDPNFDTSADEQLVLCGGWSSGLWVSKDGGYTWVNAGTDQISPRISAGSAAISHEDSETWLFSDGFADEYPMLYDNLKFLGSGKTQRASGVYLTKNEGAYWEQVFSVDDLDPSSYARRVFSEVVLDPSSTGSSLTGYLVTNRGLWRSSNLLSNDPTPGDHVNESVQWLNVLPLEAAESLDQSPVDIEYLYLYDAEWVPDVAFPCEVCERLLVSGTKWYEDGTVAAVLYQSQAVGELNVGDPGTWTEFNIPAEMSTDYQRIGMDFTAANTDLLTVMSTTCTTSSDCGDHKIWQYSFAADSWDNTLFESSSPEGKGILFANDNIKVSPVDETLILKQNWNFTGGPGFDASVDGGGAFSNSNTSSTGTTYHDDVEDIEFYPDASKILVATHGGIYITDSNFSFWDKGLTGMGGAECSGFATSISKPNTIVVGLYHNGSMTSSGNFRLQDWDPIWHQVKGGDGFESAIDAADPEIQYASSQNSMGRSDNGYLGFSSTSLVDAPGANLFDNSMDLSFFDSEYVYMPASNARLYRNDSRGNNGSWELLLDADDPMFTQIEGPSVMTDVYNSKADADIVFAVFEDSPSQAGDYAGHVFVTNRAQSDLALANSSWTEAYFPDDFLDETHAGGIPDIESLPMDPNSFIVVTGGAKPWGEYHEYKMLKFTYNGVGDILDTPLDPAVDVFEVEDFTFNCPNVHVNEIHINNGTPEYYISTDLGVFYTNDEILASEEGVDPQFAEVWYEYGQDLPHCEATGIEPVYGANALRVGTFGRGVWEIPMPCEKLETPFVVSNDEHVLMDSPSRWRQDIIVEPGGTLRFQADAFFAEHCAIKVMPGGKLYISHDATLSSACDAMWIGIEVWGNEDLSQNISNQGYVSANNASIQNAHAGIWVRQNDPECNYVAGSGGGVVRATNMTFKNCYNGVIFAPYIWENSDENMVANSSYFKDCEFVVDDVLLGGFYPKTGITLDENYGVRIMGCDFRNEAVSNPDLDAFYDTVEKHGIGIRAFDAHFDCRKACESYDGEFCVSYDYGLFENLHHGVMVTSEFPESALPHEVTECIFWNNLIGVRVEGVQMSTLAFNRFVINDVDDNDLGLPVVGIDLEGVSGHEVQENIFVSTNTAPQTSHFGISITSTGDEAKKIYRNHFDRLDEGIHVQGRNGGYNDADIPNGTMLLCNTFGQADGVNQRDISLIEYVVEMDQLQSTINPDQGSLLDLEVGTPAGNLFSHDCALPDADFNVDLSNDIPSAYVNYYHTDDFQQTLLLDCYTDERVTSNVVSPSTEVCPVEMTPETLHILSDFEIVSNDVGGGIVEMELVKGAYLGELDQGNPVALKAFLLNPANSSSAVRNQMLSCAPNISHEVWKTAFNRQPAMDPWHLSQVLLASSPLDKVVLQMMTDYALDPFYRQLVTNGQNGGVSSKSIFQNELAVLNQAVGTDEARLIRRSFQANDEGESLSAKLRAVFESDEERYFLQLASIEVQRGEYDRCLELLDTYASVLPPRDRRDDVLRILARADDTSCDRFTAQQRTTLEMIAAGNYPGYVQARSALAKSYKAYEDYWPSDIQNPVSRRMQRVEELPSASKNPFLTIRPNPSNGNSHLVVSLPEGSSGYIQLVDNMGRRVQSDIFVENSRMFTLNSANLPAGVYLCTLVLDNQPVATEKWVLNR